MDALRHTYTEQKRKLDAMKILTDKATEINALFMEEDMRAGKNPGECEHRRRLAKALTDVENAILGFQEYLGPLLLIEETPTPKLDLSGFVCDHEWDTYERVGSQVRRKCTLCGLDVLQPDAQWRPTEEQEDFLPEEDEPNPFTETAEIIAAPPQPAPVSLPGAPNPEIDEDDLPF